MENTLIYVLQTGKEATKKKKNVKDRVKGKEQ